jgi:excisionase family DNA binding protein
MRLTFTINGTPVAVELDDASLREIAAAFAGHDTHAAARPAVPCPASPEDDARARLALSPEEAATAIGCSRDHFDRHVAPELRVVRRGRRTLIPLRELERWLDREAALPVGRERRRCS